MSRNDPIPSRRIVRAEAAFRPLVAAFLEDAERDVRAMREAFARGDAETVRVKGHSLKGAGGGYGLDEITDFGTAIEQAALAGDLRAARDEVDRLAAFLATVEIVGTD